MNENRSREKGDVQPRVAPEPARQEILGRDLEERINRDASEKAF